MTSARRLPFGRHILAAAVVVAACALWPGVAHAFVFWSNEDLNAIGRVTDDGNPASVNQAFVGGANDAKGVAIDGSFIYWTNYKGNSIGRAGLDGTGADPNFITGASQPEGITVSGGFIYWSNTAPGMNTIGRATVDGKNVNHNFIPGASFPVGVAVNGPFIYWANFNSNTIGRANLDGSSPNQTWAPATNPSGLMTNGSFIYWTDYFNGTVVRANLADGSSPQTLITGASLPTQVATDGTFLYWTNRANETIGRATLDGNVNSVNQDFVSGQGTQVWGLSVALPPSNVSPPSISGHPVGGSTLSEVHGTWTNGPSSFTYQWFRCNPAAAGCVPIGSATAQTYTPGPVDVGSTIRVQEVATNLNGGNSAPLVSSPVGPVTAPPPPSNTGPPAIAGVPVQGQTLTESHGSWTGFLATFSYQWLRCNGAGTGCTPIQGANGPTYMLVASDIGTRIAVGEVAIDQYGQSGGTVSAATGIVKPLPPTVTSISLAGPTAVLMLACAGPVGQACAGNVAVTAHEHKHGGSVLGVTAAHKSKGKTRKKGKPGAKSTKVMVARGSFDIPTGQSSKLKLTLNSVGKSLLAQFYQLPATLTFSDNALGPSTIAYFYRLATPTPNGDWDRWTIANQPCGFCYTVVTRLQIPQLIAGAKVQFHCHGVGCPSDGSFNPRRRSLDLTPLFTKPLGPGATFELIVTAKNAIGRVVSWTTRAGAFPTQTVLCLPPGYRHAAACR
jgi:hypothetical protein